jgi:uncharacterized protein (DUF1800 family)
MADDTGLALAAVTLVACSSKTPPASPPPAAPATPLAGGATIDDAIHLLSRVAFGPRPGQAQAVIALGLAKWLDTQLYPTQIVDTAGVNALAPFQGALASPDDLRAAEEMRDVDQTKQMAKREHVLETQMTAIARHVASERQLNEVLVDFWTNHFSVSLQKGRVRYLGADFVERALRPHALGTFVDLLKATARHPAMLIYLDNAQSVAPRPGSRQALRGRGLNENYARELLELHTVGVGAGYTQDDVIAVARILSGWSVVDDEFVFRSRVHDDAAKTVMGRAFAAGGGEAEGVALLDFLANHPATIERVCRRLCTRLVADEPRREVIEAATDAWRRSNGEIAAVVRAIVSHPAFWSARGAKIKSPLELVVSAVRAVDGVVDGIGLARTLTRMGQPLLLAPAPTGYSDASDAWLSTAGALDRMDFALAVAAGKLPGTKLDIDRILPDEPEAQTLDRLSAFVAGGFTPATRAVLARYMNVPKLPARQRRVVALALTLASPEFQKQ